MKLKHLLIILLLLLEGTILPQRLLKISVSKGSEKTHLSYIVRKGITYVSAKELSEILSGNYYYNPTAQKVEMKFSNYNLKITAKNQFFVLSSKNKHDKNIFQIPISTLLIRNDIFLPISYSLKYIELAYQKKIIYNEKEKNLIITESPANIFTSLTSNKESADIVFHKKKGINSKYDIYGIEISEMTNGTLIRIKAKRKINMFRTSILEGKLFLFLSGVSVNPDLLQNFHPTGVVKNIKIKSVKGNKQIEFTLKNGNKISNSMQSSSKDVDSDDILITIQNGALNKFVKDLSAEQAKWNFDVIVIDPGHGGKDPGTIGVKKLKEKDVNLSIALELRKFLKQKMPEVKVVLTRSNDKFIELMERGKIANKNRGKLFISIHANAVEKPWINNPRGFEVYLLRPGRTQEAIRVAEVENSVIDFEKDKEKYKSLTDENFILVSMAHSAYMHYSEKLAEILDNNWKKEVKAIPSRGVKQAGFYVLIGASMPSILIETGFITNSKDAKYLRSKKGQQQVARTICNSIVSYKKYYEKEISIDK